MKYGKYLADNQASEFRGYYIDYAGLKNCIKRAKTELLQTGGILDDDGRETSITVTGPSRLPKAEADFYDLYEAQVKLVSQCIEKNVSDIRSQINRLQDALGKCNQQDEQQVKDLNAQAGALGDRFLKVEKFVNLNYLGLHKILKKHDKNLPHAPCRQFYLTVLHKEKWLSGDYSDVLVKLSNIFSALRGDISGEKNEDSAQGFVRSTTKHWVRATNVSQVKYLILQHLPVFQFDKDKFAGDAQLVNSVYLDNSSAELYHGRLDKRPDAIALRLRWYGAGEPKVVFVERKTHREGWKGETSVKERFVLDESKVVPFLDGRYRLEQAVAELRAKGKSAEEVDNFSRLFDEVQKVIDSKHLRPMVRTQYMRTAFQIPFDATVRISLDTNLTMFKESVNEGQAVDIGGRWFRDPALPMKRTDITRFPHAVLEVKLSLPEGTAAPEWVAALVGGPLCSEVHKFSKFIHGTCTLFPEVVQAVPFWVDDESIRKSMIASAPASPAVLNQVQQDIGKPRTGGDAVHPDSHPLLGSAPTLRLLNDGSAPAYVAPAAGGAPKANFFDFLVGSHKPRARTLPQKIEPKTFLANERTFLNWLHMAVTIGSIAAALLGFAATADRRTGTAEVASVEVICMILLPLAVLLCFYALFLYVWRARMISHAKDGLIDDRRGPLVLACVVVSALIAIFIISVKDLVDTMLTQHQDMRFLVSSLNVFAPP